MGKVRSLSMSGVRFRALTFRKMGASSKSGASLPLYKQILSKMPKELKESLVCWYSPNLQGLTNAELYNSDNLYEGGLHDLSGNGHDMTLYGFDGIEGGGHVDEEGNLVFDGVNDWGKLAINTKYNDFGAFFFADIINSGYSLSMSNETKQGNRNILVQKNYSRDQIRYINNIEVKVNYDGTKAVYLGSYRVNDTEIATTQLEWSNCLYLSRLRENNNTYTIMTFKSLILFNRGLSADEEQWCRDNMLVSQEVSKRTVTLWLVDEESGTFDKFKTLKVQNGNMIGTYDEEGNLVLPVYDIGSIYQTSVAWYTDADCTEEYIGEYITEDTFLYTKKVRTSDNMLAQLDNVVLEDGTTAREHLVCWYSPKWQGLTKESVLTYATLADLSGNGYDMDLYGFDSEQEIIDDDGALMFDGVDDYAVSGVTSKLLTDFSLFLNTSTPQSNGAPQFYKGSIVGDAISNTIIYVNRLGSGIASFGKTTSVADSSKSGNVIMTPTQYNEIPIEKGTTTDKGTYRCVIAKNIGASYHNMRLRTAALFNLTLSDIEISQVKQILKLQ